MTQRGVTSISIPEESHRIISEFLKRYGLKARPAIARVLVHIVTHQPEMFFTPFDYEKSYDEDKRKARKKEGER